MRFDYFGNTRCRDIYEKANEYMKKYSQVIPKDDLRNEIQRMYEERQKKDIDIHHYFELIDQVFSMDLTGEKYTEDQVLFFARRQEMKQALNDGWDRLELSQPLEPILRDVEKALSIGNKTRWNVLTKDQVINMKDPSPMFEGFNLYEGCFYLLTGSGGDFKSLIGLSIIQSLLKGAPLFGKFKTLQTGPVILIDEETPDPIMKHRLMNTGLVRFIESGDLHILHLKRFMIFDPKSNAWFDELVRNAERIKPKLIVFDSLTRLHNEDEIKGPRGMSRVMDRFRDLSKMGYTVILIHHFNKADLKTARGSTDIINTPDGEYQCVKTGINTLTFSPGDKTRNETFESLNLTVHGLKGLTVNEPIYVSCVGTVDEAIRQAIIEVLKGGDLPLISKSSKATTIQTRLAEMGIRPSLLQLRTVALSMIRAGVINTYFGVSPKKGGHTPTMYKLAEEEDSEGLE
jgi:archaellum biogenesis ATPase FlaH